MRDDEGAAKEERVSLELPQKRSTRSETECGGGGNRERVKGNSEAEYAVSMKHFLLRHLGFLIGLGQVNSFINCKTNLL